MIHDLEKYCIIS